MLSRFSKFAVRNIAQPSVRYFGGGGGHAAPVHLDKQQNWIENKDINKDLVTVFGWNEANDHHHDHPVDPYDHIRGQGLISFERMYFSDPYHGRDWDEPLINPPHGYWIGDDPLDTRNSIDRSIPEIYIYFFVGVAFALMFGYTAQSLVHPVVQSYNLNLTALMLEDGLRKKRQENSDLEAKRDALKADLAARQE